MMDEEEMYAVVMMLQAANPTLWYDMDYDHIDERWRIRVNGINYLGDEYREMKYPEKSVRPTMVEKLGHDKVWWTKLTMEFKMKTRGGGSSGLVLSAAPEQWLEKFMRLCVIIIK